MVKLFALTLCLAVPATAMGQSVREHCMAVFRADTPAVENSAAVMKAGQRWGPITQVRVTDKPIPPVGQVIDTDWVYELY
jgi:hypothetical protein